MDDEVEYFKTAMKKLLDCIYELYPDNAVRAYSTVTMLNVELALELDNNRQTFLKRLGLVYDVLKKNKETELV